MKRGRMLVISGPSGSGKSTLVKRLLEDPRVVFSISCTTRAPRAGEVDGRDYQFLTRDEFRARVERNAFIEWAEVYGNLYGTPREPIERALAAGKVCLLEIDVQGALKLKSLGVDALYIFISPPDLETLRLRLVGRGTDKPESVERRMSKARDEMTEASRYDHIVINRDIDRALAEVQRLAGLAAGIPPGMHSGEEVPRT
jgi:guanylate kinase